MGAGVWIKDYILAHKSFNNRISSLAPEKTFWLYAHVQEVLPVCLKGQDWYRTLTGVQRRSTCMSMVQTECTAVDAVGNASNLELFTWAMAGCYKWVGKNLERETGKKINRPLRNMHTSTLPLTGTGAQIYSAITGQGRLLHRSVEKAIFSVLTSLWNLLDLQIIYSSYISASLSTESCWKHLAPKTIRPIIKS